MSQSFVIFGVTLAIFSILVAWMFISSRVRPLTRVLASVVAVSLAVLMWVQVTAFIGYATTDEPPDGSVILWFYVKRPVIYIWALDEGGPRGFIIGYKAKKAELLFKARDVAMLNGGALIFHHRGPGDGDDVVSVTDALPGKD
jgi:hypothetical protein